VTKRYYILRKSPRCRKRNNIDTVISIKNKVVGIQRLDKSCSRGAEILQHAGGTQLTRSGEREGGARGDGRVLHDRTNQQCQQSNRVEQTVRFLSPRENRLLINCPNASDGIYMQETMLYVVFKRRDDLYITYAEFRAARQVLCLSVSTQTLRGAGFGGCYLPQHWYRTQIQERHSSP